MFRTNQVAYDKNINVLSFYGSKIILEHPNCFGQLQIILVPSKSFWLGPNHFGQLQIKFFWYNFYNLDLSKMIWTQPKWIGPVHNDWYSTKRIWIVQNNFGPKEGQDITKQQTITQKLIPVGQKFVKIRIHSFRNWLLDPMSKKKVCTAMWFTEPHCKVDRLVCLYDANFTRDCSTIAPVQKSLVRSSQ